MSIVVTLFWIRWFFHDKNYQGVLLLLGVWHDVILKRTRWTYKIALFWRPAVDNIVNKNGGFATVCSPSACVNERRGNLHRRIHTNIVDHNNLRRLFIWRLNGRRSFRCRCRRCQGLSSQHFVSRIWIPVPNVSFWLRWCWNGNVVTGMLLLKRPWHGVILKKMEDIRDIALIWNPAAVNMATGEGGSNTVVRMYSGGRQNACTYVIEGRFTWYGGCGHLVFPWLCGIGCRFLTNLSPSWTWEQNLTLQGPHKPFLHKKWEA